MKRWFLPLLALIAPLRSQSSYTVCTWNIENFGVTDRFIEGKSVKEAMKPDSEINSVTAILKRINPDILGVSEVLQDPDDKYVKLLAEKLKTAGLDLPYHSTARGEDTRIQCVLFSKYPFISEEPLNTETFSVSVKNNATGATEKVDRKIGRAPINCVIEIKPGYRVRVIQAHLKSRRPTKDVVSDETDADGEAVKGDGIIRRNEALLIKNYMNREQEKDPTERILLMGDLNDLPRSQALKTLIGNKGAQFRCFDLWLKDWLGDWWTHYYIPDKQYERIDYMIANQPLFVDWVEAKSSIYRRNQDDVPLYDHYNASDHRPLVSVFQTEAVKK
jgi:endonuclease/exonuclease/phosphatase family metal-dependent hydrolase